ncbi:MULTISPECIES: AAA family ATPase [Bacillus cereus group]|uniref:AAA family ATPase n=2 Tax=Bacillus TaxID=1386 RepID=UPI001F269633|nr:AAA family ATPase [Bacillus cereus]MDA1521042.1 hypothetical protein [Bacillus cereus]BCC50424.1 hypothetical protein BCJMU02_p2018 [Bacillus cereus]HDR7980580.1 hypothetical protein [Bacillus cereus]HDR8058531.1 hypothetical protein [Bacillus cereus]HDR8219345.1 hypothetical protein [Bacillus cereus]
MGELLINSIIYQGDQYYYKNDRLRQGINLLVGDNENGKSTFTYLIVYGLGLNVDYFNSNSDEPINEIVGDTNNFVELDICIGKAKYVLKRNIGQNMISVYDKQDKKHITYSLIRNGYVYKKEEKTFSDWILEKLGIDIIEITQNSSTHKVNFEDLMRYVYYDQITDNRKIINEFGIRSSDFYKNSNIMKRSIFEILMSKYNEEYYSTYYKLKNLNKQLQDEKEIKKALEIVRSNLLRQTKVSQPENLNDELIDVKKRIRKLQDAREEVKKEKSFGVGVVQRINELQEKIVALTHKITNIELKLNQVDEDLRKANRVGEDTKSDIEHIDKILFTSQYIDIISEDECPFCLEAITIESGHCICGSDKYLDFSRFIYSDKEYVDIMKSKVKALETIKDAISDYQNQYGVLETNLSGTRESLRNTKEEIKNIIKDLEYNSNASAIDEITSEIIKLKEREPELKLLIDKDVEINRSEKRILKLEKEITKYKDRLQKLQEKKENDLQNNIETFEEIYSNYIKDFYNNEDDEYEVKLDRNYMPVLGEYKHQSFNVPKRLFYYLTMLKMSLNQENKISYPKLLIIDTMKDEGIEINKLKKLFTYFDEFRETECQIIVTCGYDEYVKEQKSDLIDRLSDENKLLRKK